MRHEAKIITAIILALILPISTLAAICEGQVRVGTNCTSYSTVASCSSYQLYNTTALVQSGSVSPIGNVSVVQFSLTKGEYAIQWCGNATNSFSVGSGTEGDNMILALTILALFMGSILIFMPEIFRAAKNGAALEFTTNYISNAAIRRSCRVIGILVLLKGILLIASGLYAEGYSSDLYGQVLDYGDYLSTIFWVGILIVLWMTAVDILTAVKEKKTKDKQKEEYRDG